MRSYDFIEVFTILQGLKRNLLNKEELLQITRIEDSQELFKRLKAMFNLNRDISSREEIEEYFNYIINDYLTKIEPFIRINVPELNFRDLLLFRETLGDAEDTVNKFKLIKSAMGHLSSSPWKGEGIFRQWYDLLLMIFLYRVRTSHGLTEILFRKYGVSFIDLDTAYVLKCIFEDDPPRLPLEDLDYFSELSNEKGIADLFERAKVIFYSYLIKMENSMDMDDLLSRILSEIFLFVRQSELIMASINCLKLGIDRSALTGSII